MPAGTITIKSNGKYLVVPTFVDGKQLTDDEAIQLWKSGANKVTGEFSSLEEAQKYDSSRSSEQGADTWDTPPTIEERLAGAQQSGVKPSFLEDGRYVAATHLAAGAVTPQELYQNTLSMVKERYPTAVIDVERDVRDGKEYPLNIVITVPRTADKPAEQLVVDLSKAYADVSKEAYGMLSQQASQQPEIGGGPRVAAGLKATDAGRIDYLRERFPNARIIPDVDEQGNQTGNAIVIEPGKPPRFLDRKDLYNLGDVADVGSDIGQAVMGAAGAVAGGIVGGPKGALAGGVIGDAAASGAAQAVSGALPGDDQLTMGNRLAMGAVNVGAGLVGAGIGKAAKAAAPAAGRAVRRAWGALPDAVPGAQAARSAAERSAMARGIAGDLELPASKAAAPEPGSYYDESLRLQRQVEEATGEKLSLTAGQATGSKYALGVDRTLAQSPDTMDQVASEQAKRLQVASRHFDAVVNSLASDPGKLGNTAVGAQVGEAINKHVASLVKARQEAAGPLYKKASEAIGGKRIVTTERTRAAMEALLAENKFGPSKVTSQMKASMATIAGAATEKGRVTIDDIQNLRWLWGQAARGDVTMIEGLSTRNQRRLAGEVLRAIDADLDAASKSIQASKAVPLLREANAKWAEYSQQIKEATPKYVRRLLKLGDDASEDAIVQKIGSLSRNQRRGFVTLLEKADKDAAANLRAQVLDNILSAGGRAKGETEIGRQLISASSASGEAALKPGMVKQSLLKRADVIGDLFAGNDKAAKQITDVMKILDRLSQGPGWAGSDTVPKALLSGIMSISATSKEGLISAASQAAKKALERRLFSPQALAQIASTPDGVDTLETALRPLISQGSSGIDVWRSSIAAMTRLGLYVNEESQPRSPRFEVSK